MPAYTYHPDSPLARLPIEAGYHTHFLVDPNEELVVSGGDSNAALTISDLFGGWGELASGDDASANNAGVILAVPGESLLFQGDAGFRVRSRIQWTPTASDVDNVMAVGFMNAPAHGTFLGSDGAGPPANYWGACIYKVDGGTTWLCQVSIGNGAANKFTLDTGIPVTGEPTDFEIEYKPTDIGFGQVTFRINGEIVRRPDNFTRENFVPEFSLTGATEMTPLIGIKNGTAADFEILVDYFGFGMGLPQ